MKIIINKLNKHLKDFTDVLINIFVFAIVSGLLFKDPFGVIDNISKLISNISDNGIAGLISLLVIVLWYKKV
tara:strand:+ start:402 stop:617 length:216 start_codon:yes stop_codon:yes gene_type:complete